MVDAIINELKLRKDYLSEGVETIYFGGGTPSLLTTKQISLLLNEIYRTYNIDNRAEITLEANPEDITKTKAEELLELGINRISLGIQSFDDDILQKLNRAHSRDTALDSIQILKDTGFNNLTIDLIYGIPGQSFAAWKANLAKATALDIPHLSCYALTIEEKTAFGRWQKSGKLVPETDSSYAKEYKFMCDYLAAKGYAHYEVSNFAMPDFESQHNSAYWQQENYLGLGPGAHSFNGRSRQYNISNNATYIRSLAGNELPYDKEILSSNQIYNEYLLTGLRTNRGINLPRIKNDFGINLLAEHNAFIDRCLADKLIVINNNQLILTDKAYILADSIIIELMIDE